MNIIMLGPPGAGKGTQAEVLSKKMDLTTLSTGNIIRAAIAERRPVGLNAKSYMDKGAGAGRRDHRHREGLSGDP